MNQPALGKEAIGIDLFAADVASPKGKPRSLIDSVMHRLRCEIVQGVLSAGSRLLIDDLQRRFDVSGGTVREA